MAARQDSDFEFVFGNRQLFSVLGIFVVLLGIFFAMGFFAGKSVGREEERTLQAQKRPLDSSPLVIDSQPKSEAASEPLTPAPAAKPAEEPAKKAPEEPAKKAEAKRETPPEKAAAKKTPEPAPEKKAAAGSLRVSVPEPGNYLQVSATTLSEAQSMGGLLRERGLHAVLARVEGTDMIRVLVGPFSTTADSNDARQKLKSLGIVKFLPKKF